MQRIEKYVDIERNEELKEEVKKMSGMGMSIARENRLEGFSEGINEFSALMQMLLSSNRIEDAMKAASDSSYRDRLLEEYKKSQS